jgi:hypothetical protein
MRRAEDRRSTMPGGAGPGQGAAVEPAPEPAGSLRILLGDARRGAPRALVIAAVVGTFLVLVNQGDRLGEMSPGLAIRVGVTYLTPFVVSLAGWVLACRATRRD